ncbi:hydantoinase/oxoprolinase family protein [Govanella unica]|uniref:Hydantoinase/oxoprolinase family protein n=1 Tax=Govanella unica TaxID=2975056 RepID=A0A9X3TYN9_9PROT|nr:hydantoinase/oxoprolinase family protein [Govania unica]MDA5194140.1 hydantoinase/oxoprolinase family protein [Govania unica]
MSDQNRVFVGIDVGGTFTDLVLFDPAAKALKTVKVPSTPPEFFPSVVAALESAGVAKNQPATILHGTTVHLNAFLERKGAKTALLTTRGFRDVYEMRRGNRQQPYDMHFRYPAPLVPRKHIYEVSERMAADGSVLQRPEVEEIKAIAEKLRAEGIESVAICFLHSYRNDENERFVEETLKALVPEIFVSASFNTCREWREYERISTAVINAYVSPVLKLYLEKLTAALSAWDDTRLFLLQSNGGLISAEEAKDKGVLTLLSGPVGGNVAGRALAANGDANLICVDMGGTSFEASLVVDGDSAIRTEREVGGFPILAPLVDIHTIGAGGGSLGWNDKGALRVGPQSAGARPGPAGYGKGGTEATVTDANLALGRLSDDSTLGSGLELYPQLARDAVTQFGDQFGLKTDVAAQGILDVISEQMANAIRTITVRRGIDPRSFALVAYGGAGPMHAADIARLLGIPKVIVPQSAGAFSAWGMLQSDLIHDASETALQPLAGIDWGVLGDRFAPFEDQLGQRLLNEGAEADRITFVRALDLRYLGQEYAISVPLEADLFVPGADAAANNARVRAAFDAAYERTYGHSNPDEIVEIATIRLRAIGRTSLDLEAFAKASRIEEDRGATTRTRSVLFDGVSTDTQFIARDSLTPGVDYPGPLVVEEATATTIVPPDFVASIDPLGNLVLIMREAAQ